MPTDLSVVLENQPGMLAKMAGSLGRAGINMQGGCGIPCNGKGVVHFLVEDGASAKKALQGAGIQVEAEQPVLLLTAEDRPGGLAKIAQKLADARVNVNLLYISTTGQVVLGADNLDAARKAGSAS